eukprot:gene2595-3349_t
MELMRNFDLEDEDDGMAADDESTHSGSDYTTGVELETQTEIGELEKKAGSGKAMKVDPKGKGKAVSASEDPKGKGKAATPSEDTGPTGEQDDDSVDVESEVEVYEVGAYVVFYCVVESLVNDPEILPTGFYHEKGKSATWIPDMSLLTGAIAHRADPPSEAVHGLKTRKRKPATLALTEEYCGVKVISLAVDKEDLPFGNAPTLFSAWQSGMNMAFVAMEKSTGKSLKGNDKMAGPGGIGAQLLTAIEDKAYAFGDKSTWSLVLPYSHLRPIDKELLGKAYECEQPKGEFLPSASEDSG